MHRAVTTVVYALFAAAPAGCLRGDTYGPAPHFLPAGARADMPTGDDPADTERNVAALDTPRVTTNGIPSRARIVRQP